MKCLKTDTRLWRELIFIAVIAFGCEGRCDKNMFHFVLKNTSGIPSFTRIQLYLDAFMYVNKILETFSSSFSRRDVFRFVYMKF